MAGEDRRHLKQFDEDAIFTARELALPDSAAHCRCEVSAFQGGRQYQRRARVSELAEVSDEELQARCIWHSSLQQERRATRDVMTFKYPVSCVTAF
jgi:hypothetical protein